MAALFLDENISIDLAETLAGQGHFVSTTTAERRTGASDPHQLIFAADRNWTVVTHNGRDFRMLHEAWLLWSHRWGMRQAHAGILVLKPVHGFPLLELTNAITSLLADPATSLDTALYEWKRSTGWVRFPG